MLTLAENSFKVAFITMLIYKGKAEKKQKLLKNPE